ncbi:GNAT family N-acetyltransferase [Planococcus beijingensis]|uniref:GNAT family N-acetyltransferase n=1 Tax=Planococcus beijingensis TaxID=2782551 RepID=UPI00193B01E9|nr:GNAT family N-acetyltransferase [Planococcus beijingensis]
MKAEKDFLIRSYREEDFPAIHDLNKQEQWSNLVEKKQKTEWAWGNSAVAVVAVIDGQVIGCLRGLTDGFVSLYVCELLVSEHHRKLGVGKTLLRYVHELYPETRLELLASSTSHSFYETMGYRPFYGFRKNADE